MSPFFLFFLIWLSQGIDLVLLLLRNSLTFDFWVNWSFWWVFLFLQEPFSFDRFLVQWFDGWLVEESFRRSDCVCFFFHQSFCWGVTFRSFDSGGRVRSFLVIWNTWFFSIRILIIMIERRQPQRRQYITLNSRKKRHSSLPFILPVRRLCKIALLADREIVPILNYLSLVDLYRFQ